MRRDHDFLDQQLDDVRERLKDAGQEAEDAADAVRPLRSCIQPMTLRSHSVVNATDRISDTVTTRIQNVERT
jgi:hypothetical protein